MRRREFLGALSAAVAWPLAAQAQQPKIPRLCFLTPELFELDEYGNADEIGDGSVRSGLEDKAWLAQTNCPEIAIEVIEERSSPEARFRTSVW